MKKISLPFFILFLSVCLNGVAQWSQLSVNSDGLQSIFFTSSDTGYVTSTNSINTKILKTTDGGISWSIKKTGTLTIQKIQFVSKDTGFAIPNYGDTLFKTTDAGETWSSIPIPHNSANQGIEFINSNIGFIYGSDAGPFISKTTDGGNTWYKQTFAAQPIYALKMQNDQFGYAVGTNSGTGTGGFYKTTDGGDTWTVQTVSFAPTQIFLYDLDFTDSLNGCLVGFSGQYGTVIKTNDGGLTWTQQAVNSTGMVRAIQFTSDSVGFMAGTLYGSTGCGTSNILQTSDAGNSWQVVNTGPSIYGIKSLHFPNPNVGYAIEGCSGPGAVGGILKYTNGTNCFSYYSVSVDSVNSVFVLTVDSLTSFQATSYLWDFGDGYTSTLPNPSHIVSTDTAYNVCLKIYTTTGDSCNYCHLIGKDHLSNIIRDQGYTINIENPAVLSNIQGNQDSSILLFPNPTSGILNVHLEKNPPKSIINIYDITGRLLIKKGASSNLEQIDLSDRKSGIYFIEIKNEEKSIRLKFIKN